MPPCHAKIHHLQQGVFPGALGEGVQCRFGQSAVMAGAVNGVLNGTVVFHIGLRGFQITVLHIGLFDHPRPEGALKG